MNKILIYILTLVLCLAPSLARAEIFYGLAMNGAPKYSSGFTHFDYTNPDAPKGGTLHQAAIGTFDSLNPFILKGTPAQGLQYVYDKLMFRAQDEPFTMYPLVAEKVDVPADRSFITFFINPKARFQDGTQITADDLIFSFETLRDFGRGNMRKVYKLVKTAERLDPLTVKFTFGPGYNRETAMIMTLMPVLPKAHWQGKVFDVSSLAFPVGSGPYRITEMDPAHRVVYERDKNYWAADLPVNKGQYNFDRIVFDYYRDDMVAFEGFKSGQLNVRREWDATKWASGYKIPAVSSGAVIREAVQHSRTERVNALIFNTRHPPFDDVRVREALGLTLDFKWINENLFYGLYKQVNSFYPNSYLAATGSPDAAELKILEPFRADLPPSVFGPVWQPPVTGTPDAMRENLRRADELLKSAGWVVKDGLRISEKTGKPLEFELMLGAPQDLKLALSFTRGLKRLGINANVRQLDSSNFQRRLNKYDYDMMLSWWDPSLSPGSEQMLYWSCAAGKQDYMKNYAGVCSRATDAITEAIADAKDSEDLVAHVRALDRILLAGHYMIPLYYPGVDFVAYSKDIQRPKNTPLYGMVLESWWARPQ
ncbi:MAG: transporter, periplasmic substrate-binding protein [Micavibrio sp.]|nr:transporter, periplasmic substrate-binding protein [Micavibrio sp.]